MDPGIILTTWPTDITRGSGQALFIGSFLDALERTRTPVTFINPAPDAADYLTFLSERLWTNAQLASDPRFTAAAWVLGLDFDGFALPRRPTQPFIVSVRSLFAGFIRFETEPLRTLVQQQAYFEGRNARQADLVTVPSHVARQWVIDAYGVSADRVAVVDNGIDLASWDAALAGSGEIVATGPTLLAVSKLYPRKKIDVLVRALPAVAQRFPDVSLRVVGGGIEAARLRALAEAVGVAGRIVWLGDVSQRAAVAAEYRRCDLFLHPSLFETFGNVVLEAMAARRPLVVAADTAPAELVTRADGGVVVPPDDPEATAAAVIALLEDAAQRRRLGENGRRFAAAMSWTATAERYRALLSERFGV